MKSFTVISGDGGWAMMTVGTVSRCEVEKAAKLSPSWSEVPQRTVVLAGKNPWKLVVLFWSRRRSRWSAGVGRTGRFWRGGRRESTVCASWKKIHPATEQRIPRIRILNTLESNVLLSILCVLFCHQNLFVVFFTSRWYTMWWPLRGWQTNRAKWYVWGEMFRTEAGDRFGMVSW